MKTAILFAVSLCIVPGFMKTIKSDLIGSKTKSIPFLAIRSVIENHFAKTSKDIAVRFVTETSKNELLVDEILQHHPDSITVTNIKGGMSDRDFMGLVVPTVLIFDTIELFKRSSRRVLFQTDAEKRNNHLIYVPGLTEEEVTQNIKDGFRIDAVDFLMHETDESIDLVTSFMFTEEKCRKNQLLTINSFNGKTNKWTNENFFPKKYQNLHECKLTYEDDRDFSKGAHEERIIKTLAKIYNFSLAEIPAEEGESNADLFESVLSISDNEAMIYSAMLTSRLFQFAVPPGEPYTTFERMFLMFDIELWIAIGVTLAIGFIVIQIVNLLSLKVQKFVFGKDNRTPTINMCNIFLCGSQAR